MKLRIKRVAVLGAGIMGSGIAAHLANAGIRVLLLDIVPPNLSAEEAQDSAARNRFAASGLENALKAKPAAFLSKRRAALVEVGNLEDDLEKLADCDWVIEAVIEKLDIKRALFKKLESVINPGTPVTSNTSGLSIADMTEGLGEAFRQAFFVTHFFNPVRYMRLLEFVSGPDTDQELMKQMAAFCADRLGKGIIYGKDTPNFVANRIGIFSMMFAIKTMLEDGLTIDEVDAIVGKPLGRPKSAAFRTADLVGLDTLAHVAENCFENLPDDEMHDVFGLPEFMKTMLENNWLGAKTGAGFYKKVKKPEKAILSLDWKSMEYVPQEKPKFDSIAAARTGDGIGERIKLLLASEDRAANFAWKCTAQTLAYTARRLGEIADDVVNIDRAMKWGFNWELGPFEVWDALGVKESIARMKQDGIEVASCITQAVDAGMNSFYRIENHVKAFWDFKTGSYQPVVEDERKFDVLFIKREYPERVILSNNGASLIDLGDGVGLLEFHTHMNAIDADIIEMSVNACEYVEDHDWNGLMIGNDGPNFSVGANIFMILGEAMAKNWDNLDRAIQAFQEVTQRFRYCSKPVVAAPFGMTLGGGCEAAMGCDAVRAYAELYMGLVEVGVGLIPGGGGCLMMLKNCLGNFPDEPDFDVTPAIKRAFMAIGMAKVSTSAEEAKALGFLDGRDGITFNRDMLLHDAKQTVLGLARSGYRAPQKRLLRLPGKSAAATIEMLLYGMKEGHQISEHDMRIGTKLAKVLTGGHCSPATPVSEEYILELEREAFLSLCGEEKTLERINHMLQYNKPLRN